MIDETPNEDTEITGDGSGEALPPIDETPEAEPGEGIDNEPRPGEVILRDPFTGVELGAKPEMAEPEITEDDDGE